MGRDANCWSDAGLPLGIRFSGVELRFLASRQSRDDFLINCGDNDWNPCSEKSRWLQNLFSDLLPQRLGVSLTIPRITAMIGCYKFICLGQIYSANDCRSVCGWKSFNDSSEKHEVYKLRLRAAIVNGMIEWRWGESVSQDFYLLLSPHLSSSESSSEPLKHWGTPSQSLDNSKSWRKSVESLTWQPK